MSLGQVKKLIATRLDSGLLCISDIRKHHLTSLLLVAMVWSESFKQKFPNR